MSNNTVDDPDPRYNDVRGAWLEWLQPRILYRLRRCVTVEYTITGDFNEIEDDLNLYY